MRNASANFHVLRHNGPFVAESYRNYRHRQRIESKSMRKRDNNQSEMGNQASPYRKVLAEFALLVVAISLHEVPFAVIGSLVMVVSCVLAGYDSTHYKVYRCAPVAIPCDGRTAMSSQRAWRIFR